MVYHNTGLYLRYFIIIYGYFSANQTSMVLKHLIEAKRAKNSPEKQKLHGQMHGNQSPRPPFGLISGHFSSLFIKYTDIVHFYKNKAIFGFLLIFEKSTCKIGAWSKNGAKFKSCASSCSWSSWQVSFSGWASSLGPRT